MVWTTVVSSYQFVDSVPLSSNVNQAHVIDSLTDGLIDSLVDSLVDSQNHQSSIET